MGSAASREEEWDGMERNGMQRKGMEWNGMGPVMSTIGSGEGGRDPAPHIAVGWGGAPHAPVTGRSWGGTLLRPPARELSIWHRERCRGRDGGAPCPRLATARAWGAKGACWDGIGSVEGGGMGWHGTEWNATEGHAMELNGPRHVNDRFR